MGTISFDVNCDTCGESLLSQYLNTTLRVVLCPTCTEAIEKAAYKRGQDEGHD